MTQTRKTLEIHPPASRGEAKKLLKHGYDLLNAKSFRECHDCCLIILDKYPNMKDAHFLYGLNTYITRNWQPARVAFEQVLSQDPKNGLSVAHLAHIYAELHEDDKANEAIKILINSKPKDPQILNILGSALYASADNQVQAGHLEKASGYLTDLLGYFPQSGQAHWLKSRLETATSTAHIDDILEAIKTAKDDHNAAFLHYALGKEYEDLESWDKAFQAFTAGAKHKRAQVDYNSAKEKTLFLELIDCFTSDDFIQGEGNSEVTPIFMVGQARSGSTLIERAITSHSEIQSAGELSHMPNILQRLCGHDGVQLKTGSIGTILSQTKAQNLADQYLSLSNIQRKNANCFVDKLPSNFMYIPLLAKVFPRAKFVHVTRNPIDCCFANFKQLFADSNHHSYSQEEQAEHYSNYYHMMTEWNKIPGLNIIELKYEDFVQDFESQTRNLIKDLGFDWEDACLKYYERADKVDTASALQVREKPHQRAIGHSEHYLAKLGPMIEILKANSIVTD